MHEYSNQESKPSSLLIMKLQCMCKTFSLKTGTPGLRENVSKKQYANDV